MAITIYHNPRCSKSRQTLSLIRDHGIEPVIIKYLKQPPSPDELKRITELLDVRPRDLLRSGEDEYGELGLDDKTLDDETLIRAICEHPRLLQRPIVIAGQNARIGRPPESVTEILP